MTDVQVASVRADADLERALRTQAREEVQQEADRATFERRALAVERERAIAENEMQNQIELARREEQLVAQRARTAGPRPREAAADEIGARSRASPCGRCAGPGRRDPGIGEAEAAAQRANLTALAEVDHELLLAMALRELAQHVPDIGSLTITPDVVTRCSPARSVRGRGLTWPWNHAPWSSTAGPSMTTSSPATGRPGRPTSSCAIEVCAWPRSRHGIPPSGARSPR